MPRTQSRVPVAILGALAMVASACVTGGGGDSADTSGCVLVTASVSSEKIDLMTDLAREFNDRDIESADGTCVAAEVQSVASGLGAQLLVEGWNEDTDGPQPVIWSPASSAWGSVVNQQLDDAGQEPIVGEGAPFMVTPLVIAMPKQMAEAVGWPDAEFGWADLAEFGRSGQGWAEFGHPEWGEFRLGKTNPNFSTSGLSALITQTYAAAGKTSGLSSEDLSRPDVIQFGADVEASVVHYGDTTLTFLNNWYRADQRGAALAYVSAAVVEEKSVIDYNQGNPDGRLDPGEEARPPREELVAIYPSEGTLYSDNPLFILDAEWVDEDEAAGAQAFVDFLQEEENQQRVLEYGFRPGNPRVPIAAPIDAEFGVDPTQPRDLLEVPAPRIMVALLELWKEQRKEAQVTLLLDVSGSMGDPGGNGSTKLELARDAILGSLDNFGPGDVVSLVTFTDNGVIGGGEPDIVELVPPAPFSENRARLEQALGGVFPQNGTPLYEASSQVYEEALANYDPARINAVVILSDGANDDGVFGDDQEQLDDLLAELSRGSEGQGSRPVRVFPIAYGQNAVYSVLESIAEASNSAVYDASDPRSIDKVFAEVISNF